MPNGRPGDSPFTDILLHGPGPYTEDTVELVREFEDRDATDEIHDLLWSYHWPESDEEARELERKLREKLDGLEE